MRKWNLEGDLWLFTEEEYKEVPDGTILLSINNQTKVKGKDYIDMDTRGGYIAYGLTPVLAESQGLMAEFVFWKLKS